MATYAQLQAEPWWGREIPPAAIVALGAAVRARFGLPAAAIGIKGNNAHLYGGHRSAEWIRNSRYSRYGTADRSIGGAYGGGDPRWLAALDVTFNTTADLVAACQRLDAAVKAGRCPTVARWYGNLDGDHVVDGWDTVLDRVVRGDDSHLWHLHIEFLRAQANGDHSPVLVALTGGDPDMDGNQAQQLANIHAWMHAYVTGAQTGTWPHTTTIAPNVSLAQLGAAAEADRVRDQAALAAIQALASAGGVDAAPIVAAVNAVRDEARQRFDALAAENAELRAELARVQAAAEANLSPAERDALAG